MSTTDRRAEEQAAALGHHAALSVEDLRAKLRYRRGRLALAESLGYPAHTARCRARVTALEIKLTALETR